MKLLWGENGRKALLLCMFLGAGGNHEISLSRSCLLFLGAMIAYCVIVGDTLPHVIGEVLAIESFVFRGQRSHILF